MGEATDRITGVSVEGYKSLCSEQRIEIRPLTLLAGANSSGKSSIMQPLLLMKQTIESPSDPGALLLEGPNVRFTAADQVFSKIRGKPSKSEFAAEIEFGSSNRLKSMFQKEPGKGFDIAKTSYGKFGERGLTLHRSMASHDIAIAFSPPLPDVEKKFALAVHRERCFLTLAFYPKGKRELIPLFSRIAGALHLLMTAELVSHLQGVIHLPGLRGNPLRTYPKTVAGPFFPGTFETYTASVVAQWQSEKPKRLAALSSALETMGLTSKVKADAVGDTQVELRVGRLTHSHRGGAHDLVNIADVGFGVSQALPVLVALLVAQPGQLVYLEQPELHLHPNAQRRLAILLQEAATRGVVVVAETHSSLLVREVQTLVAQGKLDKDDVILHWFQRQSDGSTKITSAEIDEAGAYGDWPEDFDETALESAKAYLDAVEARREHS